MSNEQYAPQELCPYCKVGTQLITGKDVYPHRPDLYAKKFWSCPRCYARVGCHGNTNKPLGRLANKELRDLKSAAHAAFNPLYIDGIIESRTKAYKWLAEQMQMTRKQCHIGKFNEDECRQVVILVQAQFGLMKPAYAATSPDPCK